MTWLLGSSFYANSLHKSLMDLGCLEVDHPSLSRTFLLFPFQNPFLLSSCELLHEDQDVIKMQYALVICKWHGDETLLVLPILPIRLLLAARKIVPQLPGGFCFVLVVMERKKPMPNACRRTSGILLRGTCQGAPLLCHLSCWLLLAVKCCRDLLKKILFGMRFWTRCFDKNLIFRFVFH